MQRTVTQNKQLHAIIGKLKISSEHKQELIYQYTKGRSSSSADLTIPEAQALINNLNHLLRNEKPPVTPPKLKQANSANAMRRKILSVCHEMGWKENGRLDWTRINGFLLKYGHLKKNLNDYTQAELPVLVTQFEKLLKDYYAKR